jgi:hypothetical protein
MGWESTTAENACMIFTARQKTRGRNQSSGKVLFVEIASGFYTQYRYTSMQEGRLQDLDPRKCTSLAPILSLL